MSARRRVGTVVWAILMAGASVIPGFLAGAVAPFARADFELSEVAVGLSFSGFWLVGALTAAPFARLTHRIGAPNVLRIAGLVLLLSSTATALFATSETAFVVLISLGGFAPALAVPAASMVIMAIVPPRHQAFALTSASAGSAIGLLGAGFLVSSLASNLGWMSMFYFTALMGLILVLTGLRVQIPSGRASATQSKSAEARQSREPRSMRTALVVALCAVGLTNIAIGGATTFIVSSADAYGFDVELAALATAIASTASIPARVALGLITDRLGKDPIVGVVALLLAGSVGYLLLSSPHPALFYCGVALVLVPGWVWVNVFFYGILARYRSRVHVAVGMVQTTFFIGSVVGPVLIGALIAAAGFERVWLALGALTAIGAMVLWIVRPKLAPFDNGHATATIPAGK